MKRSLLLMVTVFAFLFSVEAQNFPAAWKLGKAPVASDKGSSLLCDSIVAKDFEGKSVDKIINTFDVSGNMVARTRYLWNSFSGSWVEDSRYDYTFDENKNIISSVYTLWDASSKGWKNSEKMVYSYNENRKILSQETFKGSDNSWIPTFKGMATYNEQNYLVSELSYLFDEAAQKWLAISKNEYTYNDKGLWLTAVSYNGKQGTEDFIPAFQTLYEYSESGKMTLRFMQDWDPAESKWTDTTKEVWTYDEAGNEITGLMFFKDFETGELKESTKREKQYDQRGNMLSNLFYNKDMENNWVLFQKETRAYNDKDSLTEKINYNKNMMSGELVASTKNTYSFDEKGNKTSTLSEFWGENQWVNSMKEEKTYNQSNQVLAVRKFLWDINYETLEGNWKANFKEDYTYDMNGYQTSYLSYIYDIMSDSWMGQAKSESSYDEYGNIQEEVSYQWLEDIQDFKKSGSISYYYSSPSSINSVNLSASRVMVHNRTIEVFCEDRATVCVFDTNGHLISKGPRVISVAQAGIYMVTVNGSTAFKVAVN